MALGVRHLVFIGQSNVDFFFYLAMRNVAEMSLSTQLLDRLEPNEFFVGMPASVTKHGAV
ncbi:hypothetical protein DK37_12705 [Halomonas sp. SUBG004]|nr:hypothetical protein DK37_12705 [Halomonas sp. SUBG004]